MSSRERPRRLRRPRGDGENPHGEPAAPHAEDHVDPGMPEDHVDPGMPPVGDPQRSRHRPLDGGDDRGAEAPDEPADLPEAREAGNAAGPDVDPVAAARAALARARNVARQRGLRPGSRPRRKPPGDPTLSGSGRDGRDPQLIGEQLNRLLLDRGWQADVAVGSVTARWAQIVGPDVAAHVEPVGFEAGVLTVQADSTAWATQMRLLRSRLLGRLEEEVGAGTVADLHVLGPAAPRWTRGRLRVTGRGPRDTYG